MTSWACCLLLLAGPGQAEDRPPKESTVRELLPRLVITKRLRGSKLKAANAMQLEVLGKLSELRDPSVIPALRALRQGRLSTWAEKEGAEPRLVIATDRKEEQVFTDLGDELYQTYDAYTNEKILGSDTKPVMVDRYDLVQVRVSNEIKREIDKALTGLRLASPDPRSRETVASLMGGEGKTAVIPLLEKALEEEKDGWTRHAMDEAILRLRLKDSDPKVRLASIQRIREIRGLRALNQLKELVAELHEAATALGEEDLVEEERKRLTALRGRVAELEVMQFSTEEEQKIATLLKGAKMVGEDEFPPADRSELVELLAKAEELGEENMPPEAKGKLINLLEEAKTASLENGKTELAVLVEKAWKLGEKKVPDEDKKVGAAAGSAIRDIESYQTTRNMVGALFDSLSLASILMVIALGLAITFGVMGVINMAHGEMMLIGAYCAYMVQNLFLAYFPRSAFDWYFVAAFPVSFAVAALFGIVMERCMLRFLYKRPLESLLLTFGVSLMIQQAVRVFIDFANVEVRSPSYLVGGERVMVGLELPYNRMFIMAFGVVTIVSLYLILWRSGAGLRIRAVTQNRDMAACLGVATGRVDSLTFALGAGVAGMAGCAISQLGNVGPDLGQTYIIDSFMVVVLGGVGNLLGTVVAAIGIGGFNKILESAMPTDLSKWGPILAKVAALSLVILVLQWKPQGLFAVKGRTADD